MTSEKYRTYLTESIFEKFTIDKLNESEKI